MPSHYEKKKNKKKKAKGLLGKMKRVNTQPGAVDDDASERIKIAEKKKKALLDALD